MNSGGPTTKNPLQQTQPGGPGQSNWFESVVGQKKFSLNIGILAWPLNKNKPMQKGNGSLFNYNVKRPKNFKYKSPYHKYLHDRIWDDFMLPTNRVGLAMVYAIEGRIVYSEGFGYADYETQERMTSNHVMRIASVSKEITDAGINLLVSNKKLSY